METDQEFQPMGGVLASPLSRPSTLPPHNAAAMSASGFTRGMLLEYLSCLCACVLRMATARAGEMGSELIVRKILAGEMNRGDDGRQWHHSEGQQEQQQELQILLCFCHHIITKRWCVGVHDRHHSPSHDGVVFLTTTHTQPCCQSSVHGDTGTLSLYIILVVRVQHVMTQGCNSLPLVSLLRR